MNYFLWHDQTQEHEFGCFDKVPHNGTQEPF